MAGKGDTPRPVDPQKYRDNWERIFRQPTALVTRTITTARPVVAASNAGTVVDVTWIRGTHG